MRQDGLKADQQTRINEIKIQAAEQAAEQKGMRIRTVNSHSFLLVILKILFNIYSIRKKTNSELLAEQLHNRREGMAAQDKAHQQIMIDTKSAFDEQKLKQNTDLEAKQFEVTETKNLFKEEERNEKKQLELEKREIAREKLTAQKDQIEMQLKYLNFYQTMCKTKDAESYYTDDYKKVPGKICNLTMSACEQALTNLDIGRCSTTSRAVESLKKLSHGLTKKEREDFLEALYDLEDAENKLRKLCEQMKNNVEYQSSFDELNELIKNIDNVALEMLRKRIRAIPAEESVAKARERIEGLMAELGDINKNLHDLEKILPLTAPSTKPTLKQ
ncbi:hypothetical protein WR25_18743 isoform H [Diploscapter pachys]|nr:hypothetical protein WR25_18743 isoform F [Diploscapter pachys]PAV76930.1 hypothetical protein WR25_18743 isoform G [Diploscapter pachys]PAV76931.1 hypothetical protein WR25_18743 isoform H [Diploscapter pachys]